MNATFDDKDMNYLKPEAIPQEGNITKFNNFGLKPSIEKKTFYMNNQEEKSESIKKNIIIESEIEIDDNIFNNNLKYFPIGITIISLILLYFKMNLYGSFLFLFNYFFFDSKNIMNFNISILLILIYYLFYNKNISIILFFILFTNNLNYFLKNYNKIIPNINKNIINYIDFDLYYYVFPISLLLFFVK
jgi:hypothetical protein